MFLSRCILSFLVVLSSGFVTGLIEGPRGNVHINPYQRGTINNAGKAIGNIGKGIEGGIGRKEATNALGSIGAGVADLVGVHREVPNFDRGILDDAGKAIGDIGKGIGNGVDDILDGAGNIVGGVGKGVDELLDTVGEGVGDLVGGIGNGVEEVLGGIGHGAEELIHDLPGIGHHEKKGKHHGKHQRNQHGNSHEYPWNGGDNYHKGKHEKHHDKNHDHGKYKPNEDGIGLSQAVCKISYAGEHLIENLGKFHMLADKKIGELDRALVNYLVDNMILKVVDAVRKYHNSMVNFLVDIHIGFDRMLTNCLVLVYRFTKAPLRELLACRRK